MWQEDKLVAQPESQGMMPGKETSELADEVYIPEYIPDYVMIDFGTPEATRADG